MRTRTKTIRCVLVVQGLLSIALWGCGGGGSHHAAETSPVRLLPGTSPAALAVSANGRVVAGASPYGGSLNTSGAAWMDSDEFEVSSTSDALYAAGLGVSADVSVIVGTAAPTQAMGSTIVLPFRWSKSFGGEVLAVPGAYDAGYANAVSASGDIVVGTLYRPQATGLDAFRCTNGTSVLLAPLQAGDSVAADGISSDGNVVVGYSGARAVRWVGSTPPEGITPTDGEGRALDASKDGSVAVGYAATTLGGTRFAFRWSASSGLVSLGTLPGMTHSSAVAVSDDGNVIVGNAVVGENDSDPTANQAFLWTPSGGLRPLADVFAGPR